MKTPHIDDEYIINQRKEIGQKLKAIREAQGLTMDQLADHIGIGKSTISKIEAGKWNFGIDTLITFAVHLKFKIEI